MDRYPFCSHMTVREADELEQLRASLSDHAIIGRNQDHRILRGRTTSEIIQYFHRNPRREIPKEAA